MSDSKHPHSHKEPDAPATKKSAGGRPTKNPTFERKRLRDHMADAKTPAARSAIQAQINALPDAKDYPEDAKLAATADEAAAKAKPVEE